jgi:glycosyltransferase involved in cell wall biosynthesis
LEDLIAAFRLAYPHLPPVELHVAGGPDGAPDARKYAARLRKLTRGLPIRWHGHICDVPRFLSRMDLFVQISEPAGCPNASLEAMAAGLPVLATSHGGAAEQILEGVTGWLVPPRDPQALADGLCRAVSLRNQLAAMGSAARQYVAERFSLEQMAAAYREALDI